MAPQPSPSPTRRPRAKALPLVLLGLGLACAPALDADRSAGPDRPNVIVVVVDTLRADHTSLHGYGRPTTPRLDARAAEGVVFERASAGSSWTLPSMAMLFTGSYTTENVWRLAAGDVPFPERFQAAGYRTGAVVGNRLLGQVERQARPDTPAVTFESGFERGFSHYEVFGADGDLGQVPGVKGPPNGWYGDELVARGTTWVERTDLADAPYLLWLHLFDPHHPRRPQDPDAFPVEPDPVGFEAWRAALPAAVQAEVDFEDYAWVLRETAAYDAEVAGVDAALGQLFDWLDARGEADDTVVVVTADHGEGLWQRPLPVGERAQPHNRVKQLYADHGIQLFDEQVHVPLVLLGPGLGAPRRVATPVSLVDVAPTLYELADLAPPEAGERLSGLSLLGDLDARSELYAFCSRGSSLTVDGRWRLQLPADHRATEFGLEPELYDLAVDPGEVAPVAGDPEADARRASLTARLQAFRQLYAPAGELSEEEAALRRELLDAMGYTGQ